MNKPKLHLICNAHLDPVWIWRWEEGCSEALSTFRNAVDILKEHDSFIFNHNESILYEWVKTYDPQLFKEIQKLVKKGKWSISGGWYLQPDVNIPGIESIIRQIKYGRKFFKHNFGYEPKVAYNFDSFGHGGGLPQVLNLAGYKMYIFMRPQKNDLDLPSDLFIWKGTDGTEILTYRITVGLYLTEIGTITQTLNEGKEFALKINRDIPIFWGLGNHGGGATREDLRKIDQFIEKENEVELIHSTPDIFYEAIKKYSKDVPIVKGDLQRVFTGCYTSQSRIKRKSIESLSNLTQTEALRTITNWFYNEKYPEGELEEIWKDHLFGDFHDIICGTCSELVEHDVLNQYGKNLLSLERLRLSTPIHFNYDLHNEFYIPLTIINTNTALTTIPIETECMIDYRPRWTGDWRLKLFDTSGNEIEFQEEQTESLIPFNGWRRKIVFFDKVPQFGSKNYNIKLFEGEREVHPFKPNLKFEFNKNIGLIDQLIWDDKNILTGRLLQPLVIEDNGDSWGGEVWNYRHVLGKFGSDSLTHIIEKGPIRTIYESILKYNQSKIVFHTICYSNWNVIEFKLRIHWNEEKKMLKLSIPTIFNNPEVLTEIPGGIISRKSDGEEYPHHRWLFLEGKSVDNRIGLGIVNNGQSGLDYKDGEIRLSVLRGAAESHERMFDLGKTRYRKYMDQGVHDIKILLTIGQPESVLERLPGLSGYICTPPVGFAHLPIGSINEEQKKGKRKAVNKFLFEDASIKEFFTISQKNIRLLSLKKSDDGEGLLFRMQEAIGKETNIDLNLKFPAKTYKFKFRPLEIKTVKITPDGKCEEVHLINEI